MRLFRGSGGGEKEGSRGWSWGECLYFRDKILRRSR